MSTGEIGYAEQEDAVRVLSQHYTGGRLEVEAFDDRVRRARAAGTWAELASLFSDLPEPHPVFPPGVVPGPGGADGATHLSGTTAAAPADAPDPAARTADTAAAPGGAGAPTGTAAPAGTAAAPDPAVPADATPGSPDPAPTSRSGPTAHTWQPYPYRDAQDPAPYPGWGGEHRHPPPPWPAAPDAQQPGFPGFAPGYESAPWQHGGSPPAYPPHPGPPTYGAYAGYDPAAPFGREPYSGRPYSDRQRIVGGLLQMFLPFGVGRFYTGHTAMAVAQLLVTLFTFGLGAIWSFIDGIVILAGNPTDPDGRPLRP